MGNLAFGNQKAEKIGPEVEEKLRKELGAAGPVPYQVEAGSAGGATVGSVLGDVTKALLGGRSDTLFTLVFSLTTPRPATLQVSVARQGVGAHAEALVYATRLEKPLAGEVALEAPKMFGSAKFTGDAAAAAKLNANGDLVKRANKLARTESEVGGLTIKMDRLFKIVPEAGGALLVVNTLPRSVSMGFDATLDAKEFFDVAALVAAAL